MASGNKKNIVPCLAWVKQGCAKRNPDKVSLDKEELKKVIEKSQEKLEETEGLLEDSAEENESEDDMEAGPGDFDRAVQKANQMAMSIKPKGSTKTTGKRKSSENGEEEEDDVVKRYGLDNYDEEELPSDLMNGVGGLTPFASNDDDPYITIKDEEDSDEEDFVLKPTDNLIALGKITEEAAILEVYIYNAELNNLFIHHDYILPTFPLVLEWMDYDVAEEQPGNFVAMGTMEPDIGIWDLDVVDSLEPVATLKGAQQQTKKKKKKKAEKTETLSGHSDAVLDLSWNHHVRNVLASASADKTICLWDLSKGEVASTLRHHEQQVQCVSWHPQESQTLLTGSFDNYATVVDCRSPSENVKRWKFTGEVERALWNHFNPFNFLASTDKGMLYEVDVRQDKPLFTLSAHEDAITGVSLSSQIPGLLVTSSPDKHLKVWDIQDSRPSLVLSRNLRMDILHCVNCNPDHPFVFAVGANKDFKVWDIRESAAVRGHFLQRMPVSLARECEEDDQDLGPEGEEALGAMAGLRVEGDDEDDAEEEEMLGGDRKGAASAATAPNSFGDGGKPKKRRRRKKKTKTLEL